jgi:predicted PurR-regulated permease PerM
MRESDLTFLRRAVLVAAVVALIVCAWWLRTIILLLFASGIFALLLTDLSGVAERRLKVSRTVALAIVMFVLIVLILALSAFFGWRISAQFAELSALLPRAVTALQTWLARQPFGAQLMEGIRRSGMTSALPALFDLPGYALIALGGVADVLLVAAGGIYIAAQPNLYRRGALRLLPAKRRPAAEALLTELSDRLRRWLLSQLAAMVIVGVMVGCAMWTIGVPAAGALGLFAGAMEFVPIAGPVASAVPALLMSLLVGVNEAGWTFLLFVLIQQVEGNLVIPLIQQRVARVPPLLTLFAIVSAGLLFGLLGVILATPLTIVALTIADRQLPAAEV